MILKKGWFSIYYHKMLEICGQVSRFDYVQMSPKRTEKRSCTEPKTSTLTQEERFNVELINKIMIEEKATLPQESGKGKISK